MRSWAAIGGVLFASWLVDVVVMIIGPAVPRLDETTLDLECAGAWPTAISIGTALLFGVGPAIALCLHQRPGGPEGRRPQCVGQSRRVVIAGRIMAAAEVALTVVLLAGAGLMFKSVWQMTRLSERLHARSDPDDEGRSSGPAVSRAEARARDFATALLAKAQTLPGVREAAMTTGRESTMIVLKEGEPISSGDSRYT